MARCNYCGKKGIFLTVSKRGLCKGCEPIVLSAINRHIDIIDESINIIVNTENFKTRINRINTVRENLDILDEEYLSKGVDIGNFRIDDMRNYLERMFNTAIEEEALKQVQKHMDKASLVKTATAKINNANKALLVLKEFYDDYGYIHHNKTEEINFFIYESQLNDYVQKAEKEEFKGNNKKALDAYLDALFFVENEHISNRQGTIQNLNNKINEIREKQNV